MARDEVRKNKWQRERCQQADAGEQTEGECCTAIAADAAVFEDDQNPLPAGTTTEAIGCICQTVFMQTTCEYDKEGNDKQRCDQPGEMWREQEMKHASRAPDEQTHYWKEFDGAGKRALVVGKVRHWNARKKLDCD